MRGVRRISSEMKDALDLVQQIIASMPEDPDNADDAWQLFKLFQARDCLRAAYDYERDVEAELMEEFY